jgi:uncharacterized protein (TIRG00374 family)
MTKDQPRQGRRVVTRKTLLRGGASLALLLLIFVGLIPRFANYSDALTHLMHLDTWSWVAIASASVVNQISGVWPYQAAMPGLRFGQGLIQLETATAIASAVPAGGVVAIGMSYTMFSSFGFTDVVISAGMITTGIWSIGGKLALPVLAVGLLALMGRVQAQVGEAALTGIVTIVVAGIGLWLVLRSKSSARWLGRPADRVINWVLHFVKRPAAVQVERALVHFSAQTVYIVQRRAWLLTGASLANQAAGFVLVLIIVRAVGITSGKVTVVGVFTSFAVSRLAGAIPITPGGLGTSDAAFVTTMATFGASPSPALTADLVWRLTTYLLPMLAGVVTYFIWLRWQTRSKATPETLRTFGTSESSDRRPVWVSGVAVTAPDLVPLVTSDGYRLRRQEWSGESARAVVVLVHGFVGSADDPALVREARALLADGFDVVSYDSRGHGRSEGVCTLGDLESRDVEAAVVSAKSKGLPVVLVGASMGAVAALRYAASSGSELAGVVAVSAPASWRVRRSPRAILLYILTRTAFGRYRAKRQVGVRVAATWTEPAAPIELISHISVPVAIIQGQRDPYIAREDAAAIHEACTSPSKRLDMVPGMGHAYDEKAIPAIRDAVDWVLAVTPQVPDLL